MDESVERMTTAEATHWFYHKQQILHYALAFASYALAIALRGRVTRPSCWWASQTMLVVTDLTSS